MIFRTRSSHDTLLIEPEFTLKNTEEPKKHGIACELKRTEMIAKNEHGKTGKLVSNLPSPGMNGQNQLLIF
ncbi:MAG: hypothetical protein FWG01_02755 [Betaproteobacteria bacterium]|nr:hypothetical protein [Betaproteobacteria bacterium]